MSNWSNEITAERNDLLFENRNQAYGAYLIRRQYGRAILISSGLVTLFIFFFIFLYIFSRDTKEPEKVKKVASTEVVLKDPPPVDKTAPPPPPPPPPPP